MHVGTLRDEVIDDFRGVVAVGSYGIWPSGQSGYSVTVLIFAKKQISKKQAAYRQTMLVLAQFTSAVNER
jgi:hypothetical protein